jgi:hypothetical protein
LACVLRAPLAAGCALDLSVGAWAGGAGAEGGDRGGWARCPCRRGVRAFYRVVARARDAEFDADAVGDAEYDYWKIHRDIVGRVDRAPLIASLARIRALLYGVPEGSLIASATERERAVRLVDLITSGQQAPTDEAWNVITGALVRSYRLLRMEIAASRAADA